MSEINTSLLSKKQNLSKFEITENFTCIRFIDQNKERFELEFSLEKGTSFNTYLIKSKEELFIIHPPEKKYFNAFRNEISDFFNQFKFHKINIITGHINPQIIETIKNISSHFQNLTITCSNPGFKLISELWNQRNPNVKDFVEIQLPEIKIVKKELIDEGQIGSPLSIRIKSNPGFSSTAWEVPNDASDWRQNVVTSGGGPLVFDDGHHKFALAWLFMGQAEEIHAWISHTKATNNFLFDAPAIISFKFMENRIGNLEIVYSPNLDINTKHYAQDDRIEITGTDGVLWINHGHGSLGNPPPLVLYKDGKYKNYNDISSAWENSFIYSTRDYINCLLCGKEARLTGEQGKEILRMALAAELSSSEGKSIKISDVRLSYK